MRERKCAIGCDVDFTGDTTGAGIADDDGGLGGVRAQIYRVCLDVDVALNGPRGSGATIADAHHGAGRVGGQSKIVSRQKVDFATARALVTDLDISRIGLQLDIVTREDRLTTEASNSDTASSRSDANVADTIDAAAIDRRCHRRREAESRAIPSSNDVYSTGSRILNAGIDIDVAFGKKIERIDAVPGDIGIDIERKAVGGGLGYVGVTQTCRNTG